MLNLLNDYVSDSLPAGAFATNPNLTHKVDDTGSFLPFCGNTAVFLLDEDVIWRLQQLQDRLYEAAPNMLAQRICSDSFHMTLHDLVNGPTGTPGLEQRMGSVEIKAKACIAQWREEAPLRMRGTWMFNMVNTSIVLGLEPSDPDSYERLDKMYSKMETIVPLGYLLTPHITLAYFRPGTYSPESVAQLREALGAQQLDVILDIDHLVLQNFTDMNHYVTIE